MISGPSVSFPEGPIQNAEHLKLTRKKQNSGAFPSAKLSIVDLLCKLKSFMMAICFFYDIMHFHCYWFKLKAALLRTSRLCC